MSVAVSVGEVPAVSTRDDLIREVMDELDRSDITDLQARSSLQLLEGYLNRELRVPQMEKVTTVAFASGAAALPMDFIALRAMYDGKRVAIPAVDPVQMVETLTGGRKVHAIVGGDFMLAPSSDEVVTIIYYQRIPALTANAQTNWLLASHPDVYFYGLLAFLCSRLADENEAKWRALLDQSIGSLIGYSHSRRFGGPLLQRSSVSQVRGAPV